MIEVIIKNKHNKVVDMIEIYFKSKEGKILDLFCAGNWEDVYKVIEQYIDINPDKVNEVIIKKK